MDIGEKISTARKSKGMTQADLGNKMCVTFQAVSKWERGESVPDFETICKLSEALDVPITYFGGKTEDPVKKETAVANAEKVEEKAPEYKPVLAVCEKCNKPIYDGNKIVRYSKGRTQHIKCADCARREKDEQRARATKNGLKRRKHSFIWPSIITVLGIIISLTALSGTGTIIGLVVSVLLFPFSACLILYNNVVGDVVLEVLTWSVVKFPGIIFGLDIDGVVFLIAMKVLFFILGLVLTVLCAVLAIAVGGVVSLFVYPYAIRKNFQHPEKGEYSDL